MNYRNLGNSGIKVSEIGFGAWGIGGGAYGSVKDDDSIKSLLCAFEKGINFYDTSNLYGGGRSEELIASAFKDKRSEVVIATKGGTLPHSGFHMPQNFSRRHLRKALEGSLKRLQTDYVDLYQLHSPPIEVLEKNAEAVEALFDFKKEGLVREFGISTRSPSDALTAIERYGFPTVQVNFNLIDQRAADCGLFKLAMRKKTGLIIRTPLVFGFLTGKLSGKEEFPPGDHRANWPKDQLHRWADSATLFDFLEAGGKRTKVQAAIRFCLDQKAVSVVIPGMLSQEQVVEDAAASDVPPLSKKELEKIGWIYHSHTFYDDSAKDRGREF